MVDETVITSLFEKAKQRVPIDFKARYDHPRINVEPIMAWERDEVLYLVLLGRGQDERWIECMRVVPYQQGNGVGHFLVVDRVTSL